MRQKKIEELIDSYNEEIHLKEQEAKDMISLENNKSQVKDIKMGILGIKQNKLQAEIDLRNTIIDSNKIMLQNKKESKNITDKEYNEKLQEMDRYLEVQEVADRIEEIDLDIQLNNVVINYGGLETTTENKFAEIKLEKEQEKEILLRRFHEKMRLYKISILRQERDKGRISSEDYAEQSRLVRECEEFKLSEVQEIFKIINQSYTIENSTDITNGTTENITDTTGNMEGVEGVKTTTHTTTTTRENVQEGLDTQVVEESKETKTQSATLDKTKKFIIHIYDKDIKEQIGTTMETIQTATTYKINEVINEANNEKKLKEQFIQTENLINNFFNEIRRDSQENLTANNLGRRTINSPIELKREIYKQIEDSINLEKKVKEE